MKKTMSVLLLLSVLCLAFCACSQTVSTEVVARWEDGESYVFNITKANFDYPTVTVDGNEYTKYPTTTLETFSNLDETEPADIGGTYTMSIEGKTQFTLKTEQKLYVQYAEVALAELGVDVTSSPWSEYVVETTNAEIDGVNVADECPLEQKEGYVILFSHTVTEVVFKNEESQRPLSSSNACKGFYLGKTHQEVTHYNVTAVYDWDGGQVSVTRNGETVTHTLKSSSKLIDANQILLYTRSLDKASDKFEDSPSVQVYSPVADTVYSASFSYFTYTCRTIVTDPDATDENADGVPVILNLVGVVVDSSTLLVQLNLPDTVNSESSLDVIQNAGATPYNKYTTVRFRSGWIDYEWNDYGEEILNAISVSADTAKE